MQQRSSPERIFLGFGSNIGNGPQMLLDAWKQIGELDDTECVRLSSPYSSSPVAMESPNWFTNAVGEIRSRLGPEKLLLEILALEQRMGRVRQSTFTGYQDRLLDIDLLYYGQRIIAGTFLRIPHPRRAHRLFVLRPLAEIAPDFTDCLSLLTVAQMEQDLCRAIACGEVLPQELTLSSW